MKLSVEEMQAALDAAHQAKWQSIKNAQYAWDVSYPAPKQPVTCEQLLASKLREAEAAGLRYDGAARQVLEQLA